MMLQLQCLLQMQLHGSATVLGCRMLPELLYSFSKAAWKRSRVSVQTYLKIEQLFCLLLIELLRRSFCIQPQSNECEFAFSIYCSLLSTATLQLVLRRLVSQLLRSAAWGVMFMFCGKRIFHVQREISATNSAVDCVEIQGSR